MPVPVELIAEAADELFAAKRWYQERDQEVSKRFAQAIDSAVNGISHSPDRWAIFRKNTRRFVLRRFPF